MRFQVVAVAAIAGGVLVGPGAPAATGEGCTPSASIANALSTQEIQGSLEFTVILKVPVPGCDFDSSVHFSTKPANSGLPADAGKDYEPTSGVLSWAAGVPGTQVVEVPLIMDQENEADETVQVCLDSPVGVLLRNTCATGSIQSTPVCVRAETGQSAWCRVPVDLPVAGGTAVTVDYETAAGTASPGEDYVGVTAGVLTVPAGETRGLATVEILAGGPGDPDETFDVGYRATVDGVPRSGRVTVVIVR